MLNVRCLYAFSIDLEQQMSAQKASLKKDESTLQIFCSKQELNNAEVDQKMLHRYRLYLKEKETISQRRLRLRCFEATASRLCRCLLASWRIVVPSCIRGPATDSESFCSLVAKHGLVLPWGVCPTPLEEAVMEHEAALGLVFGQADFASKFKALVECPNVLQQLKLSICPVDARGDLFRQHLAKLIPEWPSLLLFGRSVFDELVVVGIPNMKSPSLDSEIETLLEAYNQKQGLLRSIASGEAPPESKVTGIREQCFEIPIVVGIGELNQTPKQTDDRIPS